jgi:hypothetical protein
MRFEKHFVCVLILALIVAAPALLAQSAGTGALTGTVTDPTGAVIANATVTITNTATNQSRTTTTGADGSYRFALLPPGTYNVKFTATGFKVGQSPNVQINVTETPVVDQRLEVGQQSEQVTVEAGAEAVQTASSTLGTVVGASDVVALPLSNRNYTQIVGLSAGTNAGVNNATQFGKATNDFAVNGADPGQNNYQMDGVAINNSANSGSSNDSGIYAGIGIPNPDAIQEFKIQTSTYDASYGRNPGANVNVITKGGSNTWHGGLWEFLRNEDLNANSFFDNRNGGGVQQILRQNQFGGDVGGPMKKNKLFFFADYQETHQLNGVAASGASTFLVPPIPAGDRSTPAWQAALGAANCPANHPGDAAQFSTLFAAFGQMQVACDGSNINPVSLAMLNLKLPNGQYYIPTNASSGYVQEFLTSPAQFTEHQVIFNMDYQITPKNTLSGRFFYTRDPQLAPFNGTDLPGTPVTNYYANTNAVIKLTTLLTNSLINEARISGQRNNAIGTDTTPGSPQGVGQTPIVPTEHELPPTIISGGVFSMFGTLAPDISPTNQMQLADQISWSHGRHTLRAGFEFEGTRWPISFMGLERGFLFYGSFADWLIGRGGCAPGDTTCSPGNPGNTTGSSFGDITTCLFCVRSGPTGIIHNYGEHNQSAFVQDDWKVGSRLTLNLGVRWEFDGTYNDKYGNLTNVWPSLLNTSPASAPPTNTANPGAGYLMGYVVPNNFVAHYGPPPAGVTINSNGTPIDGHPPLSNFAPRIGFAFQPTGNGRLVLRGGFGFYYDRIAGDRFVHGLEQGYPYSITLDYPSAANTFSNQNPYPSTPLSFVPYWYNTSTLTGSNLDQAFLDPDLHTPLARQYNFNIQYEFVSQWVLEVGYVGSNAINLVDTYHDYNVAQLASPSNPINGITTNTTANVNARVQYLGFISGGLTGTAFDGTSNYNSLQITVRKRFSYGLTMQASYTYSKDLGDLTGNSGNSNNPEYLSQQYGPVAFSHPQRLIINYSYNLPFGKHQGLLGKVAEGWNLSGVTTIQDGTPLTFTDGTGGSIFALSTSRAQMCPGATYASATKPGSIESRLGNGVTPGAGFFNLSPFCAPPAIGNGTGFGDSGVGVLLGPGQSNWDIALLKTTIFRERHAIQFRTEFFNAFNHPQFANPNTANPISAPATFGDITATSVNPRIIQFALKYTF